MFRAIIASISCLAFVGCHASHPNDPHMPTTRPMTETSPHVEAIELVAQQRSDQIRELDPKEWWTDTVEREWVVRRSGSPGIFDTTHDFDVEYRLEDHVAARWSVDTRTKRVTDVPVPEADSYCESSFTTGFNSRDYLDEAIRLQNLEPQERAGELIRISQGEQTYFKVFPLCRMLFEARPGAEFRPPGLGVPTFIWRDSQESWSLDPITIYKGMPILIAKSYTLEGGEERGLDYLTYCLTECRWRTEKFKPLSPERMRELMEEFINLHPTGLADVAWLRKQAEDSTPTTKSATAPNGHS